MKNILNKKNINMPEFNISGTPVSFPFEPYQLQRDFMAKVIECLNNSTNGVLESPTGTGKTLSLLCSTLGWIAQKKAQVVADTNSGVIEMEKRYESPDDRSKSNERVSLAAVPMVFYTSRTHSQLEKAVKELKRTKYNDVKAVVLGSREQLCIHPDVVKEANNTIKIQMCSMKITKGTCSFFQKLPLVNRYPNFKSSVVDIEDLITLGQKNQCCPYFMSKEMAEQADIVLMPYSYLLDPLIRKANNLELNDSVLIFDEAHNVAKVCEDSVSVKITSSEIGACINEIENLLKSMPLLVEKGVDDETKFTIDDLTLLRDNILSLDKTIDSIEILNIEDGRTFQGSYMFDLLEKADITSDTCVAKIKLIRSIVSYVTNTSFFRRGAGLQTFLNMLNIVYAGHSDEYKENVRRCFKVHVNFEMQQPKQNSTAWIQTKSTLATNMYPKVINFWCLNPNFAMQELVCLNVRSIILTSGTLAPLKPLISELGLLDAVRLENPHIVKSSQICVNVVSKGPDEEPLLSNYENSNNPKYLLSLGRTVLSLSHVVPDGLLVFFPSYDMLKKCQDSWQRNDILAQIHRVKPIHAEPYSRQKLEGEIKRYYETIKNPLSRGAVFLAVCRGKISEGLDFNDENGRAVIITGLPFPPAKDPRVLLKKKYLDAHRARQNEMLSGDEWYILEATRAVNQAIGRIVRHKNDYGAIFLCDQRFNQPRMKSQLPSWVQRHLEKQQCKTFGSVITETAKFFQNHVPEGSIRRQLLLSSSRNNENSNVQTSNRVEGVELDLIDQITPFETNEALSSFNERKTKMLKEIKRQIQLKNASLNRFVDSLNLEALRFDNSTQVPQEVVARYTAMYGERNAIAELQTSISSLCEISLNVQLMLKEIRELLNVEQQKEETDKQIKSRKYFEQKCQQFEDANITDLRNHNTLKVAMEYYLNKLKILEEPLTVINARIPICEVNLDEVHLSQVNLLLDKVNKMRMRREELFENFLKAVNSSNIETVADQSDRNLKRVYEKEMQIYEQSVKLIKENLSTQKKILIDLNESYACCKPFIDAVVDTKHQQDRYFFSLVSSLDIYDDLLKNSSKSWETNKKLFGYTEKLLTEVKKTVNRTAVPVSTKNNSTNETFGGNILLMNECDGIETLYDSFKCFLQDNHIFSKIQSTTCQKDDVKVELLLCEHTMKTESLQYVYLNKLLADDLQWITLVNQLIKERFRNTLHPAYLLHIQASDRDADGKHKIIENCIRRCVSATDIVRKVE